MYTYNLYDIVQHLYLDKKITYPTHKHLNLQLVQTDLTSGSVPQQLLKPNICASHDLYVLGLSKMIAKESFYFIYLLLWLGLWNLSSSTRDRTQAHSTESLNQWMVRDFFKESFSMFCVIENKMTK